MRSRSYCEIAIGSCLLLAGCPHPSDPKGASTGGGDEDAVMHEDRKEEKVAEKTSHVGWSLRPVFAELDTGDSGGEEADTGEDSVFETTGTADVTTGGSTEECAPGEMYFEDRCVLKEKVSKILEERGRKAIAKVQQATKTSERIKAANQLLEQQIDQAGKTEDDLDEILEQLREEKREKEKEKLEGRDG